MTTIGKILVVLHLVLSIMFMAFAAAVFTAQNNWRAAEKVAQAALAKANNTIKDKQVESDRLQADWATAKAEFERDIVKLKGLNQALDVEVKTLTSDNKQLRKEVDQQRDQSALASTEAVERKKEADLQREKNGEIYISREEQEKRLTEANDKIFGLELENHQISEKHDSALSELRTIKSFLAAKELPTDVRQMVALQTPPPPLHGRILDVLKPDRRLRQELIEISIGRDSGLEVQHKLTVYRGGNYLGDIRLTMVEADKAVGVVTKRAPNAVIKVGDEVTTKF